MEKGKGETNITGNGGCASLWFPLLVPLIGFKFHFVFQILPASFSFFIYVQSSVFRCFVYPELVCQFSVVWLNIDILRLL